jgi:hypothetical protein
VTGDPTGDLAILDVGPLVIVVFAVAFWLICRRRGDS